MTQKHWQLKEHNMIRSRSKTIYIALVAAIIGGFAGSALAENYWLAAPPLAACAYWLFRKTRRRPTKRESVCTPVTRRIDPTQRPLVDPSDSDSMVREMVAQGRYALLLRPRVAANLTAEQVRANHEELNDHMALVPSGDVVLGNIDDALDDGRLDEEEIDSLGGRVIGVHAYYLDRYPVTNRQYLEFVVAGGYEQMALWDERVLAALLDFVDTTGCPGPKYWRHGRYETGTDDHPVVGICWHEAAAYARWVGKRLPSDPEWVKAGAWPVTLSGSARLQRRYPWGESMDRKRANVWGSGPEQVVPVSEFAEGVSVGGVHQLIGNVWEWTTADLGGSLGSRRLSLATPMKSIRGGAFDTYFETQATCQFQSGENPIARKHNIGFRCALGVCDVVNEFDTASAGAEHPGLIDCHEPEEVLV